VAGARRAPPPAHDREGPGRLQKGGAVPSARDPEPADWAGRYEALRDAWLGGRVTGAVGIVLRQGLLAWMRAGPLDPRVPPAPPLATRAPNSVVAPAPPDPRLVAALVELIRNRRPEAAP
jgi:hypothetical protein